MDIVNNYDIINNYDIVYNYDYIFVFLIYNARRYECGDDLVKYITNLKQTQRFKCILNELALVNAETYTYNKILDNIVRSDPRYETMLNDRIERYRTRYFNFFMTNVHGKGRIEVEGNNIYITNIDSGSSLRFSPRIRN